MSGFLEEMRAASAVRAARVASAGELEVRITRAAPPRPLRLGPDTFALLAEVKRSSPAAGVLASSGSLAARARAYAAGGAAAVSVLTEPSGFGGSLEDLAEISRAVERPVLRKDFLVDPCQVAEARAYGASGVLLIARILSDAALASMLDQASALGLFVLLETFDAADVRRAADVLSARRDGGEVLLGVNSRNLETLEVDRARFESLEPLLPEGIPCIAESGLQTLEDVVRVARLGYAGALVGTALMRAQDPAATIAAWSAAASGTRA